MTACHDLGTVLSRLAEKASDQDIAIGWSSYGVAELVRIWSDQVRDMMSSAHAAPETFMLSARVLLNAMGGGNRSRIRVRAIGNTVGQPSG